jgi:DNA-binding Xre family transcriptional regulator
VPFALNLGVMPTGTKPETGELTREIASILRGQLGRKQITNTELANAVSVSVPQMGRILAGNKQIDIELLDKICWAVGLVLREVIREADSETDGRYFDAEFTVPMLRSDI